MNSTYPHYWPQFFTATILNWKHLLIYDTHKEIIINSLRFLIEQKRIRLYSYVIMSNHIHLIWQALPGNTPQKIQLSFMKYTAQQFRFHLQQTDPSLLEEYKVNAKDRLYQFWERNSLSIDLFTSEVFYQKMRYIHNNPVKAKLCELPEEYFYSSAAFYKTGVDHSGLDIFKED